jgi:threonyl-tRNA synthetase
LERYIVSGSISVRLPDQSIRRVSSASTGRALLKDLDPTGQAIAIKVNGTITDLDQPIPSKAEVEVLRFEKPDAWEVYRHSSAHILAQAVKDLFPTCRLAIGPAIEDGFYYDFAYDRPFTPQDLEKIEQRMNEIIRSDQPFTRMEMTKAEAIAFFKEKQETYKVELIQEFEDPTVTLYRQGKFVDLCRGPHVPTTGYVKAVKLLSVAGAYWRGDERNPMLQRIYGTSFPSQPQLEDHLHRLEEAKRRDHRKLGQELDLFSIVDAVGSGMVVWHPKGALIRKVIEDYWRDTHLRLDYQFVYTPHIARLDLWKQSGHLDFYRENMYSPIPIEGVDYQLKPMNCPFHVMVYRSHLRSYRDLPLRLAELGTVYRYERSGVLHGLMRVRGFTQDDAHLFCRPDQIEEEIVKVLELAASTLSAFGFAEYDIFLSTRPDQYVGTAEDWDRATGALEAALKRRGLKYRIDPGEGVFYGPKIDMKIKDVLGRAWQCTTIQVDFNLPERFGLEFIGEDGKPHRPIMIHRALFGSLERFFGVLIEHYAGAFPTWLAPVQAVVLPITDEQHAYAQDLVRRMSESGLRARADLRNEKVGLKIREAELQRIPFMLVVGKKEAAAQTVSVRRQGRGDLGPMPFPVLLEEIRREIINREEMGGLVDA